MASAARDPAQRSDGFTNGDKLEALRKMFPNKNGMRLRAAGEKSNRNARAATLWVYLESRGEFELHETVFGKKVSRSAAWWRNYFATKVFRGTGKNKDSPLHRMGVLEGVIVPGVNLKTRRLWSVRMVVGYNLHDNINAVYTTLHSGRNKTKR